MFCAVTVAPATTAPELSVTSPEIVPVMVCASKEELQANAKSTMSTADRNRDNRMIGPLSRDETEKFRGRVWRLVYCALEQCQYAEAINNFNLHELTGGQINRQVYTCCEGV